MWEHIVEELLPNALMIGVQYDLFWTLNPKLLSPFLKAFTLRQKYDDATAWRIGMYTRLAIASVMDAKNKYPEKPFLEMYEKNEEIDMQQVIKERFKKHAMLLNQKFKKENFSNG